MKNSQLEKQIIKLREKGDLWGAGELILEICKEDSVARNLTNKVIKKDIQNLIEKIQVIHGRESANCDGVEGKSDIEILIEWLIHISE